MHSPDSPQAVTVRAPARLHLGFLDPDATLGRRWGSLGLVIDGFDTVVKLSHARVDAFEGGDDASLQRARAHVEALRRVTGRSAPLALELLALPPAHAGFGSGTQLALAVGTAFARLQRLAASTAEVARWLRRGHRSGVGIAGFDQGGLLVDGGPAGEGRPAPLLARVEWPDAWRVLLVLDRARAGLAGDDERQALAALDAFPREAAADVCHQVLMRVLPGAAVGDFAAFAAGLTAVQRRLGAHYAPAQAGRSFSSPQVARAVEWLGAQAGAAIGQSSWGPTGFAVLPSQAEAEAQQQAVRAAGLLDEPGLDSCIVSARTRGASVETS